MRVRQLFHLQKRIPRTVIITVITVVVFFTLFHIGSNVNEYYDQSFIFSSTLDPARKHTLSDVMDIIAKNSPFDGSIVSVKPCDVEVPTNLQETSPKLTKDELAQCLEMTDGNKKLAETSHKEFVDAVKSFKPKPGTWKGSGYVTLGGGRLSVFALEQAAMLRKTGSSLPLEVLIPSDVDPDYVFCDLLLPQYNGTCVYLTDIFNSIGMSAVKFEHHQYKSIALFGSSFENAMYLDSDTLPLKNLDSVFTSKVFKDRGLVAWSDVNRRRSSPVYYDIAGIEVENQRVRNSVDDISRVDRDQTDGVAFHDLKGTVPDAQTESSAVLISKKKHLKSLVLSLYYNINGVSVYYPLLNLDTTSMGKETYVTAANFFSLPFYQTKARPTTVGASANDKYTSIGVLQPDFIQDYERYLGAQREFVKGGSHQEFLKFFEGETSMFLHANGLQMDPYELSKDKILIKDGSPYRMYDVSSSAFNGIDVELFIYNTLFEKFCVERQRVQYIASIDNGAKNDMCQFLHDRVLFLVDNPLN